jgi:hypothetical protein
MKRLTIILILSLPIAAFAQRPKDSLAGDRKRLESMEIAYMTRELNLSPEESQKFWPVFNKYRDELKTINKNPALTDPLDKQQKMLDLRKKYRSDFNRILNQDRGMKVYSAEDQFRQMMKRAQMMKGNMNQRRMMGPRQFQGGGPMMQERRRPLPQQKRGF